jgi:hypothetical protein
MTTLMFDGKIIPSEDNICYEHKEITTYKELMLFFFKIMFVRNYIIREDNRSYPECMHKEWWSWMCPTYHYFEDNHLDGIDINAQISNILNYVAIVRNPWKEQKEIIIGCGHTYEHHKDIHNEQFTVDSNPEMGADCIMEFGKFSLARVIPNARGKISKIFIEGILIQENNCFVQDILELLEEGGEVLTCAFVGPPMPIIRKINNELFVMDDDNNVIPYKPWNIKMTDFGPELIDLGHDVQMGRYFFGQMDNRVFCTKTPFDSDFDEYHITEEDEWWKYLENDEYHITEEDEWWKYLENDEYNITENEWDEVYPENDEYHITEEDEWWKYLENDEYHITENESE